MEFGFESPRPMINPRRMLRLLFLVLLAAAPAAFGGAAGSAILALQTVAAQPYGQNGTIVELRGERGDPMPAEWAVLIADPSARGGVREVTVASGRVTSERTPLKGFTEVANMPAIGMAKVSMDANSLFEAVQREAVGIQLGFHWVDYTLRTDPSTMAPVWTVRLYDNMGGLVGTLGIAAQGGAVVQPLRTPESFTTQQPSGKRVGGLLGRIADVAESTARQVGDTTLRAAGSVQEFLVGERTIGPKDAK
jgi:hypothetical protein